MVERIHREFTVNVPLDTAWQHFSRIEQWPSWAKHINRFSFRSQVGGGDAGR